MAYKTEIVLASASPRRRRILEEAGIPFAVLESRYAEDLSLPLPPAELARHIARGKAREVAARRPQAAVLAADTLVVLQGAVLGKPADPGEARRMLRALSGRAHTVITGFAVVVPGGREIVRSVESTVRFRPLSGEDIEEYVRSGEPLDKAGAYGIQERGAALVEGVQGDFLNVVGLPLGAVKQALRELGLIAPSD
jgi:septum formation protein